MQGSRRARSVVVSVALAMVATAVASISAPAVADEGTPTILFGAYPGRGQDRQAAVLALESEIGRQLASIRVFDLWDQPFPSTYDLWLRDTGHTLFLSVRAKRTGGQVVPWRTIADAQPGSTVYAEIVGWANRLKAFGAHVNFTFNHEPETAANDPNGTPQDFIDAWRKVITVFREQGVTNATYVWTLTSYAFWVTDGRRADLWYPGDGYVDAIGEDAYNWSDCRPGVNTAWHTLEWIVTHLRDWAEAHPGKPLILMEWASHEDPDVPGRKAGWINEAQAFLKQPGWERFTTVMYYDNSQKPTCDFWLDSSPGSLAAFASMANDPFYGRFEEGSDTTAPTIPGKPVAQATAPGSVGVTWAASSDDIATSITYRIYRNGGSDPVGVVTSPSATTVSFTDVGLAAGSVHTYEVTASDGVNTSARSLPSDPVTVQGEAALFSDGFDDGFTNWTTVSGLSIDPLLGSPSAPSARIATSASRAWASTTLGGTFGSACVSIRVLLTSTVDGGNLVRFRSASDGPIVRLYVTASRVISVRSDVSGAQASTGVVLPTGAWTRLELCGTVGTAGSWTVYRDGAPIFGPWTANTGTTPIGRVTIGTPDVRTMTANVDEVVVDQTPG